MSRFVKTFLVILALAVGFNSPVWAGSMTANGHFYKPAYRESGPAGFNLYNAAMDATDSTIASLVSDTAVLSALVAGWAIEDQIVTLIPVACTYSDNNTFTLPGDYTSRFPANAIVQVQVAAGMVYSTVASSSYAAPTTTVNLNDTVLTDPITRVYVVATRDGLWPNGPGYVVARDYGTTRAALAAADAVAAAAGKQLLIGPGTWVLDDNISLSAPQVQIMPGADLQVATAKTLTIGGVLETGRYQVFTCTGTGKVAFTGNVPARFPEWWGAAPDAVTDCTAAIKAAIDSLPVQGGGVIKFGIGTYLVTPDEIVISTDGTVLQGASQAKDSSGVFLAGSTIKSAAGTGKVISFLGSAAATPLDDCRVNDLVITGDDETVIGLSLKWVAGFRLQNVMVSGCYDHGVYMEQVWDSSFYDMEIETCGAQATSRAGLYIYNGSVDNCNNLRFYSLHCEANYGNDVEIDASNNTGADNYNIIFYGGKCEKNHSITTPSVKAFYIHGWGGATGKSNQNIIIRDFGIYRYEIAGDIGVHFTGAGYVIVDSSKFSNNADVGTGIKLEGPVLGNQTHRLTGNKFTNVAQEVTIESSCPRKWVWTDGNRDSIWNGTDNRIHINSDLVLDRRPLVLAAEGADHASSGTGEDNLATASVPAGLLFTYGGVKIRAVGWIDGSAGNKTIKLHFGNSPTTVFPAGALTASWKLEASVRNYGSAAVQILEWQFTVDGAPATVSSGFATLTENTAVDVLVKLTGECANGADTIHQSTWLVVEE